MDRNTALTTATEYAAEVRDALNPFKINPLQSRFQFYSEFRPQTGDALGIVRFSGEGSRAIHVENKGTVEVNEGTI